MKPTFDMGKGLFWMSGLFILITSFLILFKSPFFFQVAAFQPNEVKMDITTLYKQTSDETVLLIHPDSRDERESQAAVERRLQEMAIPYTIEDYRRASWSSDLKTVILLTEDWNGLDTTKLLAFVKGGGSLVIAHRPSPERAFQSIYQQLGIIEYGSFIMTEELRIQPPFFMLDQEIKLEGGAFRQSMLALRVNDNAQVIATTESANPLLWSMPLGNGEIVFFNGIFKGDAEFTPLLTWMMTETITSIYPVLYAGVTLVDGFPFPTQLTKEMDGMTEKKYYRQKWWLALQSMEAKFDLNLTAAAVYPDELSEENLYDNELELYAREILLLGGEVAIKEDRSLSEERPRLQRVLGDYDIRSTLSEEGVPEGRMGEYFFTGDTLPSEPETEDIWNVIQNAADYGFREVAISPYRMEGTPQDEQIWRNWQAFLKESKQLYDVPFIPLAEAEARLIGWQENTFYMNQQPNEIQVEMSHFANPSYFHLRTSKRIGQTVDCDVTKIGHDLYLVQANSPRFSIEME